MNPTDPFDPTQLLRHQTMVKRLARPGENSDDLAQEVTLAALRAPPKQSSGLLFGGIFVSKPIAGLVVIIVAAGSLAVPALFERAVPNVAADSIAKSSAEAPKVLAEPGAPGAEIVRESISSDESSGGAGRSALPPGGVSLKVYDPYQPLTAIEFESRFLSDSRFAAASGTGECTVLLTAGHWRASAFVRGYEPLALPDFDLRANSQVDLGSFPLARGSSRIEGRVDAPYDASGNPYVVDLFSEHVRPCAECEKLVHDGHIALADGRHEPCPHCGFFDDRRRRVVRAGGNFEFNGLVSGEYALRAFCAEGDSLGVQRKVSVRAGGYAFADLTFHGFCDGGIELFDADGIPFTGWLIGEGGKRESHQIDFEIASSDGTRVTSHYQPPIPLEVEAVPAEQLTVDAGLRQLMIQQFLNAATEQINVSNIRFEFTAIDPASRGLQSFETPADRADRERAADDSLSNDLHPSCQGAEGPNVVVEDGANRFRVERLPIGDYTIVVRCGQYSSNPIPLDLRMCPAPSVRAVLRRDETPPAEDGAKAWGEIVDARSNSIQHGIILRSALRLERRAVGMSNSQIEISFNPVNPAEQKPSK